MKVFLKKSKTTVWRGIQSTRHLQNIGRLPLQQQQLLQQQRIVTSCKFFAHVFFLKKYGKTITLFVTLII